MLHCVNIRSCLLSFTECPRFPRSASTTTVTSPIYPKFILRQNHTLEYMYTYIHIYIQACTHIRKHTLEPRTFASLDSLKRSHRDDRREQPMLFPHELLYIRSHPLCQKAVTRTARNRPEKEHPSPDLPPISPFYPCPLRCITREIVCTRAFRLQFLCTILMVKRFKRGSIKPSIDIRRQLYD